MYNNDAIQCPVPEEILFAHCIDDHDRAVMTEVKAAISLDVVGEYYQTYLTRSQCDKNEKEKNRFYY